MYTICGIDTDNNRELANGDKMMGEKNILLAIFIADLLQDYHIQY